AGVIYLEPGFLLTLIAASVLFIMIFHSVDIGLHLTLFWAPFFLFPVELYRFAFPIAEIILWLTLLAWLLRRLMALAVIRQTSISTYPTWSRLNSFTPFDVAIILWLMIGTLSLAWARYPDPALTEWRTLIVQPALFYLMLRTTQLNWLRITDTLFIAGIIVALIGLIQFALGESIITAEEGTHRLASVYGSPNNVGLFLGRCLPFAAAFFLMHSGRYRRMWGGFGLIIMGAAALLTQSVGALAVGIPDRACDCDTHDLWTACCITPDRHWHSRGRWRSRRRHRFLHVLNAPSTSLKGQISTGSACGKAHCTL
ncbi:hypothetical protein HC928_16820, partial [bacterium]|nr:hypothetical protein [bacterium]